MVDFFRARLLYRVAGETASEALEADALHFGSDMWSSIAVLVGLGGVALGLPVGGFRGGHRRRAVRLPGRLAARPAHHRHADRHGAARLGRHGRGAIAARVRGVVAVERVRVRPVGDKLFVEIVVAVSRALPLDRVEALKAQRRRGDPRRDCRAPRSASTTAPRALDNETVQERVMVIARNLGLAVHHVTVHDIGGRLSVSLDLEVDRKLALGAAHDIADRAGGGAARRARARRRGRNPHRAAAAAEAAGPRSAARAGPRRCEIALAEIAAEADRFVGDVHDVRVRETDEGEIVNFHCRVDPALTVQAVHEKVDEVERALRRRSPSIKRVIGHAEPRGG